MSAAHLPSAFLARMRNLLGAEADAFFAALDKPPATGLRVNTLKLTANEFQALVPWELEPVPWCPAGFLVHGDARPGLHPYHAAGLYYLQEPSAMLVAETLAAQPGERVLDLAAAPGGKATHAASLMQDSGLLVANEVHQGRARALTENLARWGARNTMIAVEEVARLAKTWGAVFDRVLLDAPCSGEGMFRKSEDALRAWSAANVLGCARRQAGLLDDAAALLRPGGLLAYSTCTFAPEEDEGVVAGFLGSHEDFELVPAALPGTSPGRPEWSRPSGSDLAGTLRLWPHLSPGEGHFVALLRRTAGQEGRLRNASFRSVPAKVAELWRRFAGETLGNDPARNASLTLFGDKLHAVPAVVPDVKGLRVLRTGLGLAILRKDRLEPLHDLALSLSREEVSDARHLDLTPEDDRLRRYLQGDVLEEPGPDGWLLVTVSGFPLGWGRRARGIIKNAYPKSLRHPSG
ncbi:MAG TPA: RsmF rRNA methyltransferase first C-terminal domain-containing protein [Trueperaceae bacterium]